jgi:hypothetical protein
VEVSSKIVGHIYIRRMLRFEVRGGDGFNTPNTYEEIIHAGGKFILTGKLRKEDGRETDETEEVEGYSEDQQLLDSKRILDEGYFSD